MLPKNIMIWPGRVGSDRFTANICLLRDEILLLKLSERRAKRVALLNEVQKAKLYSYLADIFLSAWVASYLCMYFKIFCRYFREKYLTQRSEILHTPLYLPSSMQVRRWGASEARQSVASSQCTKMIYFLLKKLSQLEI